MKISILCAGFSKPHVGWVAIDEFAELLAHYFNADLLIPTLLEPSFIDRLLPSNKARYKPLETEGGDVLIVVAHGPTDLVLINSIPNCRKKYKKIFAWITDSYFYAGFPRETSSYDAVTVTAHEDMEVVKDKFGIEVFNVYQGADCLRWVPNNTNYIDRSIDIIGFGRMPPSYQNALKKEMHDAASPYLYLHSPLGAIVGPDVHIERGMLFKLLHRSKISLAFHLYVEPQGDRPRSMMVTSRWFESLLSGCVVAGHRPISRMAEDILCWPNATVELPSNPIEAVDKLKEMLENVDQLAHQSKINIYNMLMRHDWRYRIESMCTIFNLPIPSLLKEDLDKLALKASQFQ